MSRFTCLFVAVAVLGSCGPAPEEEAPSGNDCLKVGLQDDGFATAAPARVSLFFAVDTCAGQPVAGLTADAFTLYEDGHAVSKFESQQRIQPRGERLRIYSVLLIDLSGSVLRSGGFPAVRDAANTFIDQVLGGDPEAHEVALYAFDGQAEPTPVVAFTSDAATLKDGLASLEIAECSTNAQCASFPDRRTCAGWRCVDDSTNLYGAVVRGVQTVEAALAAAEGIPHKQGTVVVFTDGTDQAGRVTQTAALEAVSRSKARVYSVALGGEVDTGALQALGKDGFFAATNATDLARAFSDVAARLTALAQRYYLLEYCSPKRNGVHELRVEATVMPEGSSTALTGSVRTQFDATGFASGCTLD